MKLKLLFALPILAITYTNGQEKRWNVELNYTFIPAEGFGGESEFIDLGVKYRFFRFEFFNLGLGINGGYFWDNRNESNDIFSLESNRKSLLLQPRVFSEFRIPGLEKFRPSIGLGYSLLNENVDALINGNDQSFNDTNGGFNFNFGISYDFSNKFFAQVQYDFINLKVRDEATDFDGETVPVDFTEKLNNLRLGIGFRF